MMFHGTLFLYLLFFLQKKAKSWVANLRFMRKSFLVIETINLNSVFSYLLFILVKVESLEMYKNDV